MGYNLQETLKKHFFHCGESSNQITGQAYDRVAVIIITSPLHFSVLDANIIFFYKILFNGVICTMATFTLYRDGRDLGSYIINRDEISIGRSRKNTISIANNAISRHHVRIVRENGQYILSDLGSLNGTYVNGKRVDSVELSNSDKISICTYDILYKTVNDRTEAVAVQQPGSSKIDNAHAIYDESSETGAFHETRIFVEHDYQPDEKALQSQTESPLTRTTAVPTFSPSNAKLGLSHDVALETDTTYLDELDLVIINFKGTIDYANVKTISEQFDKLFAIGTHNLLINLEKLTLINTTAWGVLVKLLRLLKARNQTIKLANMQSVVSQPFKLLSLDKVFENYDSVEDAVEAFRKG
ncbi:MAG: FHA domain-containing protein [Chitinivibrionales bacterium]|nr:FHA domain-containing protein [Chitinivibrionales bacterium]